MYVPDSYYLGLDLSQKQDYTALAVLEEPLWVADEKTSNSPSVRRTRVGYRPHSSCP